MQAHILIVEDEPEIAELVSVNLKHAGFSHEVARDAKSARAAVDARLPDLILLDWMLPGESGLSLAKLWRSLRRTRFLPIIMLTARGDDEDIVSGLEAGADDYIVKPFSPKELVARVRALLRRKSPDVAGEEVRIGDLVLNPATQTILCRGKTVRMGKPEFRLLNYFMSYPDRIHTRSRLLDDVWGDHVFIEERTVDVHIKRLRAALGQPDIIETVRGTGYRLRAAETQSE